MYKLRTLALILLLQAFGLSVATDNGQLLDRVVATVGCGYEKMVFTSADLNKASIVNNFENASLELLINQAVLYLEAKRFKLGSFKISASNAEIDARLERVKHLLGVPGAKNDQFAAALKEKNLTLAELREQVVQNIFVQNLLSFSFPDKMTVPLSAIEAHYRKNPEIVPEKAHIMLAEVNSLELEKLCKEHKDLFRKTDTQKIGEKLDFVDLGIVEVDTLDEATKSVIKYAAPGTVHVPEVTPKDIETNASLKVIKVVEKIASRTKTLEERKAEISREIEAIEKEKLYRNYVEGLREQFCIKIFS